MSLDAKENVLWLATESGLVRRDLDTLTDTLFTEIGGIRTGSVPGVLIGEPGQVWVLLNSDGFWHESKYGRGYANWMAFYDGEEWVPLPRPVVSSLQALGIDKDGALWLISGAGYGIRSYQCTGYPDDWNCVYFDMVPISVRERFQRCRGYARPPNLKALWGCVVQPKKTGWSIKALLQECARRGGLLSAIDFWRCLTRAHQSWNYLEPPACTDWRAYSDSGYCFDWRGARLCATSRDSGCRFDWDRDGAGRLVFVSPQQRQVLEVLPWPSGLEANQFQVTRGQSVWLFADRPCVFETDRWRCFEWPYARPTDWIADPGRDGVWANVPGIGLMYLSPDAVRFYLPEDRLLALPVERDFEPYRLMPQEEGVAATTLAETNDGRIWAGTDGAGLWVYDEQDELWWPTDVTQDFIDALLPDSSGGLWIGTRFTGLVHYDGEETWQRWRIPDGLPSDTITSLAQDNQGRLWVGTADDGLVLFDGRTWQRFDTTAIVGDGHITEIVVDESDVMLFGHHRGVGRYDGAEWEALPYDGRGWPVAMALDDTGQLWAANYLDHGLDLYTPDGVLGACELEVYWAGFVRSLLFDEADRLLWAGSNNVIFQVEIESQECRYVDQLHLGPTLALLKDRQGRLWAAGYRGVSKYDPSLLSVTR
jgi:streptogramin lyase